jgi:hypothetical protein
VLWSKPAIKEMMMMRHFNVVRSRRCSSGLLATSLSSFSARAAEEFSTEEAHLNFLNTQARLPAGFSCGTRTFGFHPKELPTMDACMTLSLLALDDTDGTPSWSAMFTKNAFPGSPVLVGRELLARDPGSRLRGLCVNNKISNVFPGGSGVQDAKDVAAAALAALLQQPSSSRPSDSPGSYPAPSPSPPPPSPSPPPPPSPPHPPTPTTITTTTTTTTSSSSTAASATGDADAAVILPSSTGVIGKYSVIWYCVYYRACNGALLLFVVFADEHKTDQSSFSVQ